MQIDNTRALHEAGYPGGYLLKDETGRVWVKILKINGMGCTRILFLPMLFSLSMHISRQYLAAAIFVATLRSWQAKADATE